MPINRAALGLNDELQPEVENLSKRLAKQLVEGRSREDLIKLAGLVMRNQAESEVEGEPQAGIPQTPDELWNYIVSRYGVRIARVSVCDDHDTPFAYVCAGFFETYPNVFGVGPRGGGKSYDQALLHDLNSEWKPGCESATFGAVEEQAKRVYAAFKTFVDRESIVGEPRISETNYKPVGGMTYGSKVEVLGGTVAAVNGPHPQKAHSDEVEIMRSDTWRESRNLASAKTTPDGRHIKAQNMATSTMKWKGGRVWQTLEAFKRAKEKAIERFGADKELVDDLVCKTTQFYVLTWCIFEVAEQTPNCRDVPENSGLPEWEPGLDRAECKCDCNEIVNGVLEQQDENGAHVPRTLQSECQGRFYRSRGHRTRAEVIQLFLQNDERTWSAQQLCRETETEGLYIPSFSRRRHGLSIFPFDIANGPVYSGTDWGFTDEAAVLWIQYLERSMEAVRYDGRKIVLPRGARVAISERTIAQKTATELGQEAILREVKLANVLSVPRVIVRRRWADLQGAGDRRDWAKMGLKTARYSTRNFEEHVKEWRGLVDADRFFVVVDEDRFTGMGCPVLCEQLEGWREEDGKESRELPQHVCLAAGQLVDTLRGEVPVEQVAVGDYVLTRNGYERVKASGMTSVSEDLYEVEGEDGVGVVGTAAHPFWTQRGWVAMSALRYDDYLWSRNQESSSEPNGERSRSSKACATGATPRRSAASRLSTSSPGTRARSWAGSIKRSGKRIMALSRRATRSIITTATPATTRLVIFAASPSANIAGSTTSAGEGSPRSSGPTSSASFLSLAQLSRRRSSERPSALERSACGPTLLRASSPASSAGPSSRPSSLEHRGASAPTSASPLGAEQLASTTSSASADAEASSRSTATPGLRAVRVRALRRLGTRASVFNLTVEGTPEFFANGILVHNCSAGRYVVYGMHDVYNDSGAQSPEQQEAQRLQLGQAQGPAAQPYRTNTAHEAAALQESWRAAV